MNETPALKETYDPVLEFSRITPENWRAPDRKDRPPFGMGEGQWIKLFLAPKLDAEVPRDVARAFEIARSAMIYSWFFYPLATLGLEQCTRISELAARERCRLLGKKPRNFSESIKTLAAARIIRKTHVPRWEALRHLRNNRSHLNSFMLTDPGDAANFLHTAADLINRLFL